jgi:hypothetical protein
MSRPLFDSEYIIVTQDSQGNLVPPAVGIFVDKEEAQGYRVKHFDMAGAPVTVIPLQAPEAD